MIDAQQQKIEKIQNYAVIASALLAIVTGGAAWFNLPMPRSARLALALVMLVNAGLLVWTVRRLKR